MKFEKFCENAKNNSTEMIEKIVFFVILIILNFDEYVNNV